MSYFYFTGVSRIINASKQGNGNRYISRFIPISGTNPENSEPECDIRVLPEHVCLDGNKKVRYNVSVP